MKYTEQSLSSEAWNELFEELVKENPEFLAKYEESFHKYFEINASRSKRVLKRMVKGEWLSELPDLSGYSFEIITEPWCGDSAFSFPVIQWIAQEKNANFGVVLRDAHPEIIDQHLTNGGRSIPKLIISKGDTVIGEWGPRPQELQELRQQWVEEGVSGEELHLKLQKWYNQDKGKSVFKELKNILD